MEHHIGTIADLISVFVVHCLNSLIPIPKSKISRLASEAEQAGSNLTWSETPDDRFSCDVVGNILFKKYVTHNNNNQI